MFYSVTQCIICVFICLLLLCNSVKKIKNLFHMNDLSKMEQRKRGTLPTSVFTHQD